MGITCADVGGLYDSSANAYKEGAEPCIDPSTSDDGEWHEFKGSNVWILVGIIVGVVLVLAILTFIVLKMKKGKALEVQMTMSLL